ncbi:THO complex subunit 4-like [Paramacrobiotus metropolitanus]|uniref:THO complex subunit 4-like n=1 Tax=Paramacrobiotus metropolitanus TaxID=2943436 RepID=UPI00244647F5|nr:THO complex subunit 4-like [Paramacrobiotus metropolitanus]
MVNPRRSKRLNPLGIAGVQTSRGRGRGGGRGGARGKGRAAVIDARANINQRQARGGRRGRGMGVRSRLGGRISDARQILDSQQAARGGGGRSGRGTPSRSRISRPSAVAAVLNSLSLTTTSERNVFSQAVRAAMAPVIAPLLSRGSTTTVTSVRTPGNTGNGPCALRVANLAQTVTVSDLNDLFSTYPSYVSADFEAGGIAVVRFAKRDAAEVAMEEYNNRELDGRTMVIQLDTAPSAASHGAMSRLGPKPSLS